MRVCVRTFLVLACLLAVQSTAWAQATIAGLVKDASGAVLPGVTVEAASPVLIEKVRTTVSDGAGRYRIENLQPGTYSLTFTLPGFVNLKRDGVLVGGTGVITIDGELRVGGVQETVTVTGETPVVDIASTKREVTLDNETMRALPSVRSYSYLLTTVPGLQTNVNNVNSGPVFAIFPIHGGRGVESRLTVEGMNISNPPGGNQPPNYVADIGNAQEVTMTTSGGLGESETAGLTMNIVPRQGGNSMSGLFFASGFSEGMQSDNYTPELQQRGAIQPTPLTRVYDVNLAVGGPIVRDRLWYYMSGRVQGSRQNILNTFYNQNAGNPNIWAYVPDLNRPAFYDRTWENYTPRITWQASDRNKFSFSWDEQYVCRKCTGTASFSGSPAPNTSPEADGKGEFSPQRVQSGRWTSPVTNRLLLEAGFGTTFYQWAGKENDPNPTRDLVRVVGQNTPVIPGSAPVTVTYRSQNWYENYTRGSNWAAAANYVTGSHSLKVGYQGNYWRDDREMFTNNTSTQYTFLAGVPSTITMYANGYQVKARARQDSFYVQDQWTIARFTLQGALRYDHPWSYFPATTIPASRFFPGASFEEADGVTGYHDITPRFGAAYDVFGNGRTALKVNLGKYLQGASVSNLGYASNPVLRTPAGTGTFGGIFPPSMTRTWQDDDLDFVPDCELTAPGAQGTQTAPGGVPDGIDFCGPVSNTNFASTQLIGATFDPDFLSGWGKRPSDWSLGISVQQELFPRASVEVAYHRRWFTMYTTGGSVTDNLAIGPSDVASFTLTEPSDPRLPGGGGQTIGPLYNTNPNVFGQLNQRITPTDKIGDDTRMFNGVDVTFSLRNAKGITFSGGTSTGKVENDWCDIRAAVPENYLLNPYCNVSSPWLTSVRGLVTYTIPRIDVQVSSVIQDKPNVGTDQIGSIAANYTMTAADQAAAAAQIGRPLTAAGLFTVNLAPQGEVYGPRIRQLDISAKKILRFGGQRLTLGIDLYNLTNDNVSLGFNQTFVPGVAGWQNVTSYMNPRVFRLSAEFAF
jgi:Carboxypeptidase regulatory-like domain